MDYGFSKTLSKKDDRQAKWKKQRKERGFDDTETWALDSTLACHILPRLKRFKEVNNGFPGNLTSEGWDAIIDEMIFAFEFVADEVKRHDVNVTKKEWKRVDKGLALFGKWYLHLWW